MFIFVASYPVKRVVVSIIFPSHTVCKVDQVGHLNERDSSEYYTETIREVFGFGSAIEEGVRFMKVSVFASKLAKNNAKAS